MKREYKVLLEDEEHSIDIDKLEEGFHLSLDGQSHRFDLLYRTKTLASFLIDGSDVLEVDTQFVQDKCTLNVQNVTYHLEVFDPRRRMISQSDLTGGGGAILAPMPGKIVDILAKVGESVEKGQALVVIEAMKMQNELGAPMAGTVSEIATQVGEAVEADQKLVLVSVAQD